MTRTGERKRGFLPLADMTAPILDPVLRRRAGLNIQLLECWPEIVGEDTAAMSQPLKILWPRRVHEGGEFEPAALVIACEGFAAMKIQHESGEIIQRINAFFGFAAVARLKIEQKPLYRQQQAVKPALAINEAQKAQLETMTASIENSRLRQALFCLGVGVLSDKNRHGR
ncbi:MAG: Hypothetical protein BHV28_13950 [Candidatus Tokpelaia hoelldobleri]|uniref:DUF721 domain-containing protein n=1 Tax=Candidatus Tokpelaia hoelldobleri TaxID=1902579 RepID=A0A1U9JW51_9HYPH|nr:MAG: Hypothetical protein BHV28_13950 [Candidatus Tokpelaia hoelldoblerii]